ncbi:MAG: hypothetical protein AAF368_07150 [Planctomycetota bacterium]
MAGVGPGVAVRTAGMLKGPYVVVDGERANSPGRNRFTVPGSDGGEIEIKLVPHPLASIPDVEVDGARHVMGPRIPAVLFALSILPVGVIAVGGALGGLFGGAAIGLNQMVLRMELNATLKSLIMLGATAAAGVLWFVVAMMIRGT